MSFSNVFIAIMALVILNGVHSQAQQGPKDDSQPEQDQPFFDNRKNKQKPRKDRPAPAKVILYKPAYDGSGCPAGSTGVAMTTDNRAVSIVFSQFLIEAGAGANRESTEKNCRMIIPIEAPQGFRMAIAQLDYRGFKALPNKARAKLVAVHRIRHQLKKVVSPRTRSVQVFDGPNAEDFYMSATLEAKQKNAGNPVKNTCGGMYNLEIDTSLFVKTNPTGEQAMITLDSIDGQIQDGSVAYHLEWEQCK